MNRERRLSNRTIEAAINCVEALANDPREPDRYREWYTEALGELRAYAASVLSEGDTE